MHRPSHARLAQHRETRHHRGRRRGQARKPIGRAAPGLFTTYCVALAILLAVALVALVLAPIVYVGLGVFISRVVARSISWSEHHATIHNVARAKLGMILNWPVALPKLMVEMWLAEVC